MKLISLSSKECTKLTSFIVVILTLSFLINFANLNNILAADEKGYELREVKDGVYIVSANGYNIMFLATGKGVIVIDASPNIGDKIFKAITEVTNDTIKYLIYIHSHNDHI